MTKATREMFLEAAIRQFAEKGFYGTSIASIAEDLGLTKQALLHHFGSKERLYAQVLEQISADLLAGFEPLAELPPAERFAAMMTVLRQQGGIERRGALIVIRELMDNQARLEKADTWYLKPFLDTLVSALRATAGKGILSEMEALARIYHLLGALNYFAISRETLKHMYGATAFRRLERAAAEHFDELVQQASRV